MSIIKKLHLIGAGTKISNADTIVSNKELRNHVEEVIETKNGIFPTIAHKGASSI